MIKAGARESPGPTESLLLGGVVQPHVRVGRIQERVGVGGEGGRASSLQATHHLVHRGGKSLHMLCKCEKSC
jgi:hypothetical protein